MLRPALVILALLWAAPVSAKDDSPPTPRDQVSFQVEATREVPNDWLSATLGVEEESTDAATLAARINQRMAPALALAKGDERLTVSSGAYQTQPVYDKTHIARWRARQDLVIETGEAEALTQAVGKLQSQGFLLRGVSFSVSPDTRKRTEDELIVEGLSQFRERAGLIARGLGRRGWNLVNLNVGESGVPIPFERAAPMAMDAMVAKEAAPSFESGRSTLRVQVGGTVELE